MTHVEFPDNNVVIAVDVQSDFLTGALAVPDAPAIFQPLVARMARASAAIATQDWHPTNHSSFAHMGGQWPMHCVATEHGAALPILVDFYADVIVRKGQDAQQEAYSGFQGTDLAEIVRPYIADGCRLVICGLATDYCVKATVLDALKLGAHVVVPLDSCRGVAPDTTAAAIREMRDAGAVILDA